MQMTKVLKGRSTLPNCYHYPRAGGKIVVKTLNNKEKIERLLVNTGVPHGNANRGSRYWAFCEVIILARFPAAAWTMAAQRRPAGPGGIAGIGSSTRGRWGERSMGDGFMHQTVFRIF